MARYALVIGIAEYDSSSLPTLKKSATDAEAVARILEQYGNFQEVIRLPRRWIKEESRYEIAINKRLTGEELIQGLKIFLLEQAAQQEALIYFAGHGFEALSPMGVKKGYLATSNCAIDGRNAIPLDEFNWLISQSELSSLVVLLDCCHAGSLLERNLLEPTLTAFETKPDYYFITACRSFEKAYEDAEHGIFTGAVLKGLALLNADEDGQVSSDRAFDFIRRELKGSGQEPIRMGRGRSITLVTYPSAHLATTESVVATTLPVPPATPVFRGAKVTQFIRQRLLKTVVVLVAVLMIPLVSTVALLTPQAQTWLRLAQANCFNIARKQGKMVIAIADFSQSAVVPNNELFTEERLLERLEQQKLPNVEICPTTQKVSNSREAHQLGEKLGAAVVIWGRLDSSTLEVFVEQMYWEEIYLTKLSENLADALKPESQTQYWPERISLMTAHKVSKIYESKEKITEARKILQTALENAELNRLDTNNKRNAKLLSQAYLFWGLLIERTIDSIDPNCNTSWKDCQKAVQVFQRASDLDEKQYEALLSQASLQRRLQQPEKALKVYTRLINSEPESSSAIEARQYRADIYLEQGKAEVAVEDLQIVCQLQPEELMNYHRLGFAQLQAGQTAEAIKTYRLVKLPSLDKDDRATVVDNLRSLAKNRPDLTEVIKKIMATIQASLVDSNYRVS
jgi:tetratricopeptide (TPR) repeat protein